LLGMLRLISVDGGSSLEAGAQDDPREMSSM